MYTAFGRKMTTLQEIWDATVIFYHFILQKHIGVMCFNLLFSRISDQGTANCLPEVTKFFHKTLFFLVKNVQFCPSKFNEQAISLPRYF